MKTIVSAIIALSVLASIAAPASAEGWAPWAKEAFSRSHASS
jgi:hypothetical protein